MPKKTRKTALIKAELAEHQGAELPDREAMSLANLSAAAPINAAVVLNALSDNSIVYANAEQTVPTT
jgi:hypothetical protein